MTSTDTTHPLARRALESIHDTRFAPLHAFPLDYINAAVESCYPGMIKAGHHDPGRVDSPVWIRHPFRVVAHFFGHPGDILIWQPCPKMIDGFAAIRVSEHRVVWSSPHCQFTQTGRVIMETWNFARIPDIIVRFR